MGCATGLLQIVPTKKELQAIFQRGKDDVKAAVKEELHKVTTCLDSCTFMEYCSETLQTSVLRRML